MKAIDEQIIAKPLSPVVQNWTREVVTLALSLLYWKVELLLSRARGPIMFAPIFALNVNEKKITWSGLELPSINLCTSSEMDVGWKNDTLLQQKIFTQKIISIIILFPVDDDWPDVRPGVYYSPSHNSQLRTSGSGSGVGTLRTGDTLSPVSAIRPVLATRTARWIITRHSNKWTKKASI